MRIALDTNILAYAEGINGVSREQAALAIVERLPQNAVLVPVQVLGELFNVLVRKAKYPSIRARTAIFEWQEAFSTIETSTTVMLSAVDLVVDHQLGMWDAVILASAAEAGCRLLLSEDMQDGFTWKGVTVANPFLETKHPLLDAALKTPDPSIELR